MSEQHRQPRVAFVEDKKPDFANVARHLSASAASNRWTNFGPVWAALRARLEQMLALPADRVAIPCASGTHALIAAAALAERQQPLRWLAPDYAFRATAIGPFAGARFIDCNAEGAFDVGILAAADPESYDAVVALNPFGLMRDMSPVVDYLRPLGKTLVIDNAIGLLGFDRRDHAGVFECISLHHTKPFGFGEGGCLIPDRGLEAEALSAIDFGYEWQWPSGTAAVTNGKMSEPSAAYILDRLERTPALIEAYRNQFERVLAIAGQQGFRLLVDRSAMGDTVCGHLPLLSPGFISEEDTANDLVAVGKYYLPVTGLPNACAIYERIINVPCHPGMAALSDGEIDGLFRQWADRTVVGRGSV
jgi:dTDP-4-amino-4,6-dideoxygalactose transaminase